MSAWRYIQHGQERGPIDEAELQRLLDGGTLSAETLVWREGSSDWVAVRTVSDFRLPSPSPGPTVPPVQPPPGVTGPPPAVAPLSDAADIEQNKVYAILAYIG